ncbi:MAG: nucleoside triphosphate pyrophosphohydrolase [Clostridiales bacterium]|nr:nucleoside triphosphate pyrophosphohydrolase [Clostridiales bacterium]
MIKALSIVGVGPKGMDSLSYAGYKEIFESGKNIILTTAKCPIARNLEENGIEFNVLDEVFEVTEDYDALSSRMCDVVFDENKKGEWVLCVLGEPTLGESLVEEVLFKSKALNIPVKIFSCVPLGASLIGECGMVAPQGVTEIPLARAESPKQFNKRAWCAVTSLYNKLAVSSLKLMLYSVYPEEHEVYFCARGKISRVPLYEIDRLHGYSWSSAILIPPAEPLVAPFDITDLCDIMVKLRSPEGGCPWDREQTSLTLRQYLIEEAHEAVQAITNGDVDEITEELGDVLLQVVFHADIAKDMTLYTLTDVINAVCLKMIHRHPHVFGSLQGVSTSEKVLENWEAIKRDEKKTSLVSDSINSLPESMETLLKAYKVQKKAAGAGMDFKCGEDALKALISEVEELKAAPEDKMEDEAGDVIFSLVNVLRHMGINPEIALQGAVDKFSRRFTLTEKLFYEENPDKKMSDEPIEALDVYWDKAKKLLQNR